MTQPRAPLFGLEPLELLLAAGRGEPDARELLRSLTGGREVQAGHLREKPTLSVIARLTEPDSGGHWWAAGLTPDQRVKGRKARKRAADLGVEIAEHVLADGSALLVGPAETDPRLADAERELTSTPGIAPAPSATLNYNPWRRAVRVHDVAGAPTVIKLARSPLRLSGAVASSIASSGGPALPTRLSPSGRLLLTRLLDPGPGTAPDPLRAGRMLARIHAHPPLPGSPPLDWVSQLSAIVGQLTRLRPERARVLTSLAETLRGRLARDGAEPVLLHGDFSADQVLLDGDRSVAVDFDRHSVGAPSADLGAYLAVELLSGAPADVASASASASVLTRYEAVQGVEDGLVAGYLEARGQRATGVTPSTLGAWTALHLLLRASEPFRACAPDWRADIDGRLAAVATLLHGRDEEPR